MAQHQCLDCERSCDCGGNGDGADACYGCTRCQIIEDGIAPDDVLEVLEDTNGEDDE